MQSKHKLLFAAALALAVHETSALSVQDTNPANVLLSSIHLLGANDSYSGTFTLPAPFTDADWDVISATATFKFFDTDLDGRLSGGADQVQVVFQGGENFFTGGPVNFTLTFGPNPIGILALQELQDGVLEYTVSSLNGTFWLDEAKLVAEIEPAPKATPDGGATASLLGLGCVAAAALRRKLS